MEVICYDLNGKILNFDATSDKKLTLIISKEAFPGSEEMDGFDPDFFVSEEVFIRLPFHNKEVHKFFNGYPTYINYKIIKQDDK